MIIFFFIIDIEYEPILTMHLCGNRNESSLQRDGYRRYINLKYKRKVSEISTEFLFVSTNALGQLHSTAIMCYLSICYSYFSVFQGWKRSLGQ